MSPKQHWSTQTQTASSPSYQSTIQQEDNFAHSKKQQKKMKMKKSKTFIPIRLIISMLGVYACALVYTQRSAMSVAIVAMTTGKNVTIDSSMVVDHISSNDSTIVGSSPTTSSSHYEPPEFDWNEQLQGIILGSQFYLYIITPIIAGRLCDRFGAKWINFSGAAVPCLLSLLTPVGVRYGGATLLIVIRIIDGAFHGCVYATLFSLYTRWFPPRERANANASLSFGGSFGSAVMYSLAGWLCDSTSIGWPLVYYVNATLYLPWMVLWWYFVTDDPMDNPHISAQELQYIQCNIEQKPKQHRKTITTKRSTAPWFAILTSIPVLCSLVVKMCSGWGYFLLMTKMPSYLATVLGISLLYNGSFLAIATVAQGVCALLAAPLSNFIIKHTGIRSIVVRKIFQSIAMFGPALCLTAIAALSASTSTSSTVLIILLLGAMFLYGFFTGGEWTTGSEYAPNSAGVVFGVSNCLAFAMGTIAPYIVGVLLDSAAGGEDNIRHQWNVIFYITAGIYAFGSIVFLIFGTDQQQKWDKLLMMNDVNVGTDTNDETNENDSDDDNNRDDHMMVVQN